MKNDREVMQALFDGETLVHKNGLEFKLVDNNLSIDFFPHAKNVEIKQKTININGIEVPMPLREYPKVGTVVFLASTNCTRGNNYSKWRNEGTCFEWIEKGIVHLTQEAAQKHIDALLSFTKDK